MDDDDPARDWDTADTVADDEAIPELLPDGGEAGASAPRPAAGTGPVPLTSLAGYDVGYRAGLARAADEYRRGVMQGQQDVLDVLRLAYRSLDISPDIPAHLEAWVRARLPKA